LISEYEPAATEEDTGESEDDRPQPKRSRK
jgi:hypothetical protein